MALVGGSQNRAADLHDSGGIFTGEPQHIPAVGKHSLETVPKTQDLPPHLVGGAENAP